MPGCIRRRREPRQRGAGSLRGASSARGWLAVGESDELALERDVLLLQRIVVPDEADYCVIDAVLAEARQYPDLW
jgi:hypothetical protein